MPDRGLAIEGELAVLVGKKPNEAEALALGRGADVESAAATLARVVPTVVVKRGALGAYARSGRETISVTSPATDPVDTTGAGDSFDAGYLFGWLTGLSLRQRLEFAVACGSLSTRGVGGTTAQPTVDEAWDLAARR